MADARGFEVSLLANVFCRARHPPRLPAARESETGAAAERHLANDEKPRKGTCFASVRCPFLCAQTKHLTVHTC